MEHHFSSDGCEQLITLNSGLGVFKDLFHFGIEIERLPPGKTGFFCFSSRSISLSKGKQPNLDQTIFDRASNKTQLNSKGTK